MLTSSLLLAAVLAGGVLVAVSILAYQVGARSARNDLLFVAAFAAFVVLLSVDSTGGIPLLAPLPALLVALLFALAAVRRSVLLRLAGLCLGTFYAVAGILPPLTSAFT